MSNLLSKEKKLDELVQDVLSLKENKLQPDQTEPNQIVQDQTVPDQEDL
jgi:hypothetical protein